MADMRDVILARKLADEAAEHARQRDQHRNAVPLATEALRLELRALAVLFSYAMVNRVRV